jgi:lysophospholipase L1-like esterase
MMRRCLVALTALLLAGCDASGPVVPPQEPPGPEIATYVALGDSFTAGPFVPTTDLADGCFRSDGNYPSLVAERLDVETLVDVSCSGAATRNLIRSQPTIPNAKVPPQLESVPPDADLVTIGIGGNDFELFSTLAQTCTRLRAVDPGGSPCADQLALQGVDLVAQTEQIGRRVERSVRRVQRRAPGAQVLLVGYLRLVPDEGSCPRRLPFARGDYDEGARVTEALNAELEQAAERAGAGFIDAYALSEGHDICSERPWVNGVRTDRTRALAYHPFAEGMEAVADAISGKLA